MRSIVVYADRSESMGPRLQSALALARATSGHVSVLIDTPIARYMAMDAMGASYLAADAVREAVARDDAYAEELAEQLRREDVPFDIMRAEEEPVDALTDLGRLADVIVLSRGCEFVGQVAVLARTPVLLVNPDKPSDLPARVVTIAWDGGYESAAALRASLPMLHLAQSVHLISIGEKSGGFPAVDALQYLSRHGVKAELHLAERHGTIEESLATAAAQLGTGLMVMGAFGHSRLREFLIGGVTRYFLDLKDAPPLLLAH
jgi:nucleotide-binding universal stress UspA family protein